MARLSSSGIKYVAENGQYLVPVLALASLYSPGRSPLEARTSFFDHLVALRLALNETVQPSTWRLLSLSISLLRTAIPFVPAKTGRRRTSPNFLLTQSNVPLQQFLSLRAH